MGLSRFVALCPCVGPWYAEFSQSDGSTDRIEVIAWAIRESETEWGLHSEVVGLEALDSVAAAEDMANFQRYSYGETRAEPHDPADS